MFVSPLLNKAIENLSEKEWKLSLELLSVISFYLGWILHNYNDSAGYTLMNFVFVYIVGAAIRHFHLVEKTKKWQMVLLLIVGGAVTFAGSKFVAAHENLHLGFTAYNSPFVILTACAVFCLFGKLQIQNRWVNKLAASMLTVYLLTDGGNLSKTLYGAMGDIATRNSASMTLLLFVASAAVITVLVACLDQVRQAVYKKLFCIYENLTHSLC